MIDHDAIDLFWKGYGLMFCGKQYQKAFPVLLRSAELGEGKAAYLLSMMCEKGWGTKKSIADSLKWLQVAACHDVIDAKLKLAVKYFQGKGVGRDKAKGVDLLEDAARLAGGSYSTYSVYSVFREKGCPDYILGEIYASGGSPDYEKAVSHFSSAAKMLYPNALQSALRIYEGATSYPVDTSGAEKLCQDVLANCCAEGRTTVDELKSLALYRLRSYAARPRYTLRGESRTIEEWSSRTGIKTSVLFHRLEEGCSDADVLKKSRFDESTMYEYRGVSFPILEWAKLSHRGSTFLCNELENGRSIKQVLDSTVAKVGDEWLYYRMAATQRGIPCLMAIRLHREGMTAQEIADMPYKPPKIVVLEYGDCKFSMEELMAKTHLNRYELKRRLDNGWEPNRILTERLKPRDEVFSGEVDIGDARMTIGDWMRSFGITFEDLYPHMECDRLNVIWNRKTMWVAVEKWIETYCREHTLCHEKMMVLLGQGWSCRQIDSGCTNQVPENWRNVFVEINGIRKRLSKWQIMFSLSEKRFLDCLVNNECWDIENVRSVLKRLMEEQERKRIEASKITWQGLRLTPCEWAKRTNLPEEVITARYKNRWHVDDVFGISYPCKILYVVDDRRYTPTSFLNKFGITYEEYKLQQNDWSHFDFHTILRQSLKMSEWDYPVSTWLEILKISEHRFRTLIKERQHLRRIDVVTVLRVASSCKMNMRLRIVVNKWIRAKAKRAGKS